jgi:cell division protein FtsI/penicillin-binding protein 2
MPRRFAAVAAVAAVLLVGVLAALVLGAGGDEERPGAGAIDRYLAAWARGDDAGAAALTDRPGAARRALEASRAGLEGARVTARVLDRRDGEDERAARVAVAWDVPRFGRFAYEVRITAAGERVHWRERAVHPALSRRTRLGTRVRWPRRAAILDRDGRALVTARPVVDIAVEVGKVRDPAATASALAAVLDVDGDALARRIGRAGDGRFIPVITLREAAFDAVEDEVVEIPGAAFNRTTAQLAPTPGFGRALLGTVGPATAEQVEDSKGRLAPGDVTGQSGLSQAYDERLAGAPSRSVVIRYRASGVEASVLAERGGRRGRPLRTRLDRAVQAAAEAALDADGEAALVAVEPSSGDVLAVANRPEDSTYDRALLGRYPPGSTFKVVSTAALLAAGLAPDETVDCPATLAVEGKPFRNFEGSAAGAVPFREDFAESCNTAFVSLAGRLGRDDLTQVARGFGLGERLQPGVGAVAADVPPPRDGVGKAAMMIGQDRILASPLAMAGVAATVADGRWRAPRLLESSEPASARPLDPATLATLRELMRAVVTSGTGTALAGVPGEVLGKSGTAEYGGGDPPPTHAWFIATRGDVAIAVLVEGGSSGGAVAAPIAARFFSALDAR